MRFIMWAMNGRHSSNASHDDVIKWKHFPRYWPFVRGVTGGFPSQRPVRRSFDFFSLIFTWTNDWTNNRDACDLRHHRNVSKTNYMVFSPRSRNISNLHLRINSTVIERVYDTKFLGVQIDAQLSWKKHIEYTWHKIVKKCWNHNESQKEVT